MSYLKIANHYRDCFIKHGDNHKGVDWPNHIDTLKRHKIMYELMSKDEKKYSRKHPT